ncbi:MAG: COX15/CtaA family protein [Planctomycetota bacterium]|nr:COX15/CtaA family protein [Planctomycetota bacterium]
MQESSTPPTTPRSHVGIHRLARYTAEATFILIIAGGLVTSTGSGLAVPDWPLAFGSWFPRMVGGVFFEHGHRIIAGMVALLILSLTIWIWRREARRSVKVLASLASVVVLAQVALGGATVLLELPAVISISHAALAQTFFCLTIALVVLTSPGWLASAGGKRGAAAGIPALAALATVAVFGQLVLGAVLRHTGGGLLLHVLGAVLVFVLLTVLSLRVFDRQVDQRRLFRPAILLMMLLVVQIALGTVALVAAGSVLATTAHVAVGALILATCVWLSLWSRRLLTSAGAAEAEPGRGEALFNQSVQSIPTIRSMGGATA